jgi:pimeloyl-ACP methyl ester carboxylesterase
MKQRPERRRTPSGQMARDAIAFLAAMEFGQADVLGFSIGSFVAQDIAVNYRFALPIPRAR